MSGVLGALQEGTQMIETGLVLMEEGRAREVIHAFPYILHSLL